MTSETFRPLPLDDEPDHLEPPPWERGRAKALTDGEIADHKEKRITLLVRRTRDMLRSHATTMTPDIMATALNMLDTIDLLAVSGVSDKHPLAQLGFEHDLLRSKPFQPIVVDWIKNKGLDLGLPNTHKNIHQWAWNWAGGEAWRYALEHLVNDNQKLRQQVLATMISAFLSNDVDIEASFANKKAAVLTKALGRDVALARSLILQQSPQSINTLKKHVEDALKKRDIDLLALFLTPQAAFFNPRAAAECLSDASKDQLMWLNQVAMQHSDVAQAINSLYPYEVSKSLDHLPYQLRMVGFGQSHDPIFESIFGKEHPMRSAPFSVDQVGHLILEGNEVVLDLAHTPQGRQMIVDSALAAPWVLFYLLAQRHAFSIDVPNLLAWDSEKVRAWRDPNGCCVAHYALVLKNNSETVFDALLTRLINLVPEWKTVQRHDGVGLMSLYKSPQRQAVSSRKHIKEIIRQSQKDGEMPATSKAPSQRRRM